MVSWPIVASQGQSAVVASRWYTRANALSLLRLVMAPALATAIVAGRAEFATALFALAVATDFADGAVARRYGESSPLGGLIDHAIDATLLRARPRCARGGWRRALGAAGSRCGCLRAVRARLEEPRRRALRASRLGRWNGIAYFVAVAVPIVRDTLGWSWPGAGARLVARRCLVATTLVSMADRALALWHAASGLSEQLAVRAAQEAQPDRRVEEDEEVVLHEAEGGHLRRRGPGRAAPTSRRRPRASGPASRRRRR